MTAASLVRIAWARKGAIAAPLVVAAGVAALLGWTLSGAATYRAASLLSVTEGAHAEAVFACRSLEVLDRVLERREFEDVRRRCSTPAELAERVTVTVLGEGRFRLEVDAPSAAEAERLAAGIAAEAARSVRVLAEQISAEDAKRAADLEERLRQAQANEAEPERELSELVGRHQLDTGPQGEFVSRSRARLAELEAKEADLRRQLAGMDAETAALAGGAVAADEGASAGGPGADPRLAALDSEIAALRRDLTDEHPRLARLVAERSRLASVPVVAGPAGDGAADALRATRAERARTASVLAALEKEIAALAEHTRTEAANAEALARRLAQRLASARAEVARAKQLIEEHKDAAGRNRASKAAIEMRANERAHLVSAGPSVAWLALAGAALGLIIGGLAAALAESLDPAIRSGADVVRHLDLPVLATVRVPGQERGGASAATTAWVAVFLLTAAALVLMVYPGWGRLKATLSRGEASHAVEEVTE